MDYSEKGLANWIQDVRSKKGLTTDQAHQYVYNKLLNGEDSLKSWWRGAGRWFLKRIDDRTAGLTGCLPPAEPIKTQPGQPWFAALKEGMTWMQLEARIGPGFDRKAWGKLTKRDLYAMSQRRARAAETLFLKADLYERAAKAVRDDKTLAEDWNRVPKDVQVFIKLEVKVTEDTKEKSA